MYIIFGFYKFKKISIPLSKDGSWELIGKKTQHIYSAKLTWIYLAQTKDNQLSNIKASSYLLYDLIQLSLLLFFTGGVTNPFIILLIIK